MRHTFKQRLFLKNPETQQENWKELLSTAVSFFIIGILLVTVIHYSLNYQNFVGGLK